MEKEGEKAILIRCVLSLERKIGKEDEFRVPEGSELSNRGPTTEKVPLPRDVWS